MVLNSFAAVGFLLLILADFLWVKGKKAGFLHVAGYVAVGGTLALLIMAPDRSGHSMEALPSALLVITSIASASLLFWSVFIEIGAARKKRGMRPSEVYSGGTYGLCRHPGFWWFSFLVLAIGMLRGVSVYSLTIFLMIVLDLLLIFMQDRYTFPKVFSGYDEYKKRVPFLFPRWKARETRKG